MSCCSDCKEGKKCKDKNMDTSELLAKGVCAGVAAALYETAFNGVELSSNIQLAMYAAGVVVAADVVNDRFLGMKHKGGLIGMATEPALAAAGWYMLRGKTGLMTESTTQLLIQGAGYDLAGIYGAPSILPLMPRLSTPSLSCK
jgi:hypothetical protein